MSSGLSDLIGDNYKLRHEVELLERSAWASRDQLRDQEHRAHTWRMLSLLCTLLLLLSLGMWAVRPHRDVPAAATAAASSESPTPPVEPETTAPSPEIPVVTQRVPVCASGKWITLFGSFGQGSKLSEIVDRAIQVQDIATPRTLDLKFSATNTSPDNRHPERAACFSTLGTKHIILYVGPVNSANEAALLCRQLGWITDSLADRNQCYGKALDPALRQQTVWPNGVLEDD
jgi:hypothetical protein